MVKAKATFSVDPVALTIAKAHYPRKLSGMVDEYIKTIAKVPSDDEYGVLQEELRILNDKYVSLENTYNKLKDELNQLSLERESMKARIQQLDIVKVEQLRRIKEAKKSQVSDMVDNLINDF